MESVEALADAHQLVSGKTKAPAIARLFKPESDHSLLRARRRLNGGDQSPSVTNEYHLINGAR